VVITLQPRFSWPGKTPRQSQLHTPFVFVSKRVSIQALRLLRRTAAKTAVALSTLCTSFLSVNALKRYDVLYKTGPESTKLNVRFEVVADVTTKSTRSGVAEGCKRHAGYKINAECT
jgi:hypothetical protein